MVDERYATILPGPVTVARLPATNDRLKSEPIQIARMLALALELRDGLLALADAETAWERRWPWLQAAKACEYVVKRLEGAA